MSRLGILMVAVAMSAALAAQTTRSQEPGQADAKAIQTAPPIPWLDSSLANRPDGAAVLAIAVAGITDCSAGSSAICYGLCSPRSDHANREHSPAGDSAEMKRKNALKSTTADPITESRKVGTRKLSAEPPGNGN